MFKKLFKSIQRLFWPKCPECIDGRLYKVYYHPILNKNIYSCDKCREHFNNTLMETKFKRL